MEVIFTLDELSAVAQKLQVITAGYKVFAFFGEMGVGKTTFIHAWCEALGVSENISSPTFSIINQYKANSGELIYHIDLYRLKDAEEAISSGVEDCLFSGNSCLVEWPEKALGIFPDDTLQVYIYAFNANSRKLVIDKL